MKAFERSKARTEVKDRHARYYAVNDLGSRKVKPQYKDADGRRYSLGPKMATGVQRLYVKLPPGGHWYGDQGKAGSVLELFPLAKGGADPDPIRPILVHIGVVNSFKQKRSYVDVRGWE